MDLADLLIKFTIAAYMSGGITVAVKKFKNDDYFGGFVFLTIIMYLVVILLLGIVEKLN